MSWAVNIDILHAYTCKFQLFQFKYFSLSGYSTAITIKELQPEDILEIEKEAREILTAIDRRADSAGVKLKEEERHHIFRLFLRPFAETNQFRFKKSEKILIFEFVKLFNDKVKNDDYYSNKHWEIVCIQWYGAHSYSRFRFICINSVIALSFYIGQYASLYNVVPLRGELELTGVHDQVYKLNEYS